MPLFASGVGRYGSIGGTANKGSYTQKAAGNSNMMPAKSVSAEPAMAAQHVRNAIANAKKMARGASGASRINVKA